MRNSSDAVIVLQDVHFSYDGFSQVLKGLSLEVVRGERILVLGHNGSGKSTLVKIMGALQTPSQGACFICGQDTSDEARLADIHRKVSVVFQNPESQIVAAIVEDDAAFAPENQGLDSSEIEKRISWALEKTGLIDKRSTLSSSLSGGEKQRLALAGALAADSVCLILDEPVAMLDPEGCLGVGNVLRDLHASGMTIVQVTHRLEDVCDADRILILTAGQWAWQGGREEFWERAESLGFELPPLPALGRRLKMRGVAVPGNSVEDYVQVLSQTFPDTPMNANRHAADTLCDARKDGAENFAKAPCFEVQSLSYSYSSATPVATRVLHDVSCLFPEGCWTSVLGRTGSGKSTLIQHLNGLYRIQAGEIFMKGMALPRSGAELRELRRRVGLVFQSPETQLFSPTVREELEFAPLNWGLSKEATDEGVARAMENVGLDREYLGRNPLRLSGGERRLVAIASVLSADPGCLVLDEPTAGLDARYRRRIIALLSRLREDGTTIVTVTHDLEMAFARSDRLLVLDRGIRMCEGGVRATLPALLEMQGASMLPEILRVSGALRCRGAFVPLTWDLEELCGALGL